MILCQWLFWLIFVNLGSIQIPRWPLVLIYVLNVAKFAYIVNLYNSVILRSIWDWPWLDTGVIQEAVMTTTFFNITVSYTYWPTFIIFWWNSFDLYTNEAVTTYIILVVIAWLEITDIWRIFFLDLAYTTRITAGPLCLWRTHRHYILIVLQSHAVTISLL